jgi:phosphoribulokinase
MPVPTVLKEKRMNNNIRFIGGLWRLMDGKSILSFITYDEALAYYQKAGKVTPWEGLYPQTTSDDIVEQIDPGKKGKKA